MKAMNIPGVVTHVVSGDLWAGAEVQVFSLCRALKASNELNLTAIVFNEGILSQKLRELGIPVDLADESRLNALQMIQVIRDHCRKYQTQLLHTHGFKENILGIVGKDLAHVPYSVRTVHGNPESAFKLSAPHKWLIHKLDHFLGRFRQQAVVAVSTQLEERLSPVFPGKVHKIFNFVDVEAIRAQWPKLVRQAGETKRLGIIGRLTPVKRVDLFIKTIALLNRTGENCRGIIIGTGPLDSELRELAESLGVTTKIEFRGFVNPAFTELRTLDALLMTSDHEGLPLTLLEALSLEIPVIGHRVGGIPEVLDQGACGWLVDEQTPEAYASVTSMALNACEERARKCQRGLAHATGIFGKQSNTEKYLGLYNRYTGLSEFEAT
ncbi:glycosyltransferase [Marinobacter sp. M216]|uniref:Glycosyltransferase n=1 Tax=Marinobacter albus TaxID=3030833 RepID=A0ABT7HBD1_9GAMM|nr:glycosyltransferase [Marinobacter sp. M216]MDK9557678.1 glycosyltransferase [Marinobacter sp. M216]